MRTPAAAGKRKRQESQNGVHHHVDIKQEADVHSENSGAEGGAPATDVTFADQALNLWFDHEGSPFTDSDEEFMPFV
jgi:hypothetical protein